MSTRVPLNRLAFDLPLAGRMVHVVRAAAFWAAIVLPIGYPFLLSAGLDGTNGLYFVGLLAANAVALAVGHDYDPGSPDGHDAADRHGVADRPDHSRARDPSNARRRGDDA
ncbi:hypothetical protein SAMN04488066_12018 [Halorubrum aquaticum]|uniref:Uncharacterized protein n=1 Tax=Halorubrum aquaticum TaxID=387340 RepID=A0A1I3C889_9EURY|nr:hypothetical protein [Halorubrum aquaticum]SFH70780.1 hypothetical protein SAMN04488066_12018 [Halorubrum aquaticum]